MLHPDRRQWEREAKRDDQKVIACLIVALLLGIMLVGLSSRPLSFGRHKRIRCNGDTGHAPTRQPLGFLTLARGVTVADQRRLRFDETRFECVTIEQ